MRLSHPIGYLPPEIQSQLLGMTVASPMFEAPMMAASAFGAMVPLLGEQPMARPAGMMTAPTAPQQRQFDITAVSDKQLMHFARQFNTRGPNPDEQKNAMVWDEIQRRQQLANQARR